MRLGPGGTVALRAGERHDGGGAVGAAWPPSGSQFHPGARGDPAGQPSEPLQGGLAIREVAVPSGFRQSCRQFYLGLLASAGGIALMPRARLLLEEGLVGVPQPVAELGGGVPRAA